MGDLSKLKIEAYDFLAVIVPGVLVACEIWILIRGWSSFAQQLATLSGAAFTLLLLVSFALGPVVQEIADVVIKRAKGPRYFKQARDKLWKTETGEHVRRRIASQLGHDVENVDVAFDYCLTRVQGSFTKRDLFVANSDLARSIVVVCWLALLPLSRIVFSLPLNRLLQSGTMISIVLLSLFVSRVSWSRMVRFRALSETPVFHSFLAQEDQRNVSAKGVSA